MNTKTLDIKEIKKRHDILIAVLEFIGVPKELETFLALQLVVITEGGLSLEKTVDNLKTLYSAYYDKEDTKIH